MEYEINEIKCPHCGHTREQRFGDIEVGETVLEDEKCEECGEYFVLKSEIYSIDWGFESLTTIEIIEEQFSQNVLKQIGVLE